MLNIIKRDGNYHLFATIDGEPLHTWAPTKSALYNRLLHDVDYTFDMDVCMICGTHQSDYRQHRTLHINGYCWAVAVH